MTDAQIRNEIGVEGYWCGRISKHTKDDLVRLAKSGTKSADSKSIEPGVSEAGMAGVDTVVYDRFKQGLFEHHSEVSFDVDHKGLFPLRSHC